jgi:hypothetical protein
MTTKLLLQNGPLNMTTLTGLRVIPRSVGKGGRRAFHA